MASKSELVGVKVSAIKLSRLGPWTLTLDKVK